MIRRLTHRLSLVHPNHRRIAAGAFWVGLFLIAAKLCVAAREVAIAWRYGVSSTVDAYQLALTVTTWLPTVLGAVAASVLVPRLVAVARDGSAYRAFVSELNAAVLLLGAAITAITWIAAPFVVHLLAGTLDPATAELTRLMSLRFAPLALLALAATYLSIRLQARERYGYSFAEAIPAAVIAIAVVALPDSPAAAPLIWATLAGYVLQILWLAQITRDGDPPIGALALRHRSPEWTAVYGSLLIMLVGQVFIAVAHPIDQAFAASLGEGAVATLGYANRVVSLVVTFGSVLVARALLPVLSGVAADRDDALGRSQALKWSWLLAATGGVTAAIGWLLAPWGVALLFERGAFTGQDSAAVAEALRFGLLQLPVYFGGLALVQWFAASGRYDLLLYAAAAAVAVKIVLNLLLVAPLGLAGIMLGTAGMYAASLLILFFFVTGTDARNR